MAGHGRRFNFHGKFDSKREAMEKERDTPNSFILYVNGYYYVVSPKGKSHGHESHQR